MSIEYGSLTDGQKAFSMYYISCCEGGGDVSDEAWAADNYDAIQYGDPFTLGIMQWAAGAAASLLQKMRGYDGLWQALPQAYRDDLESHGTDYDWWYSRGMTWDEHVQYRQAVFDHLGDAKAAQHDMWYDGDATESLSNYCNAMVNNIGINTDNVKTFFYYMQIYHLSPVLCQQTWQRVGDTDDLRAIADTAVGILSTWRGWETYGSGWSNRMYDYAIAPLESWDGESAPDGWGLDPGSSSTTGGEPSNVDHTDQGSSNASADPSTQVRWVSTNGQDISIHFGDGHELICHEANGGNVWIPHTRGQVTNASAGANPPDAESPADVPKNSTGWAHASELQSDLEAVLGQWTYSQADHGTDPWSNGGYTDCSGMVWWGIHRYEPDTAEDKLAYEDGYPGNTAVLMSACGGEDAAILRSDWGDSLDESRMLPGDIIECQYDYADPYMRGGTSGSHVMMYFGNDVVIDCPSTPEPRKIDLAEVAAEVLWWGVYRPPYHDWAS